MSLGTISADPSIRYIKYYGTLCSLQPEARNLNTYPTNDQKIFFFEITRCKSQKKELH